MKKYNLKDQTMSESDLQKIYNCNIYPRDSKILSDRVFVNIDNGLKGGTHWTCCIIKIRNLIILIVLVDLQIHFYLNNYLNR